MLFLDSSHWSTFSHARGTLYWRASVSGVEPRCLDEWDLDTWAEAQHGNWAAIIEESDSLHLITDVPRSFPLFYSRQGTSWLVATDINHLIKELSSTTLNPSVVEEFRNVGNVFGRDTLVSGVCSARAFSITTLSSSPLPSETFHTLSFVSGPRYQDREVFFQDFYARLRSSFQRLIEVAQGRQLVVPLSGGADSRLLLALLKELNASNVITFTYGQPGSRESTVSEQVAQACGIPWLFVEIQNDEMRRLWSSPTTESFLAATWSGNALPHIQDWFALQKLVSSKHIDQDAIVLPGHTIVGNEHDEWIFSHQGGLSRLELLDILGKKHYLLQGKPKNFLQDKHFCSVLDTYLDYSQYEQGVSDLQEITALINLLERQAKYINNSVRAYEYFGLEWALPMIEHDVARLWHQAPFDVRDVSRKAYISFVDDYFHRVTGTDLDFFSAPLSSETSIAVRTMRWITDTLHLRNKLNNLYRARVEFNHPMGFHNLVPALSRPELAMHLMRGRHILGVYADLFVNNHWIPQQKMVPTPRS